MFSPPEKVQIPMRLAGGLFGLLSLSGASLSALFAEAHMKALGHICGAGASPHCGWCYAAVSLALVGLTACTISCARSLPVLKVELAPRR